MPLLDAIMSELASEGAASALSVVVSLVVIEALLSVDNALAIAAMASHLPERQRELALRAGMLGAYAFRGVALLFAGEIASHPWLKIAGAAYLIHLMAGHFAKPSAAASEESGPVLEEARASEDAAAANGVGARGFWATVLSIELLDLSLSVDNVVAAAAMSPKLWVVCTGVFIGILALRFVAGFCIKLIERFPVLEDTAFVLIGFVGLILVGELSFGWHVDSVQKFFGIVLILCAALLHSEWAPARRAFTPMLGVARIPLRLYAAVSSPLVAGIGWGIRVVFWEPFRWAWRRFRHSRTGPSYAPERPE